MIRTGPGTLLSAAVLIAATGCDDDPVRPGEGLVPLSVSFAMTAPPEAPDASQRVHTLSLGIDSVRLARGGHARCEPHDDDVCPVLVRDTALVVFPDPGETLILLAAAAPEGRYGTLGLRVRSVRVHGLEDGRSFVRSVRLRNNVWLPLPATLVLDPPSSEIVNLTVLADPERLFVDADGAAVDPRTADIETLARVFAHALSRSLVAFRDDAREAHPPADAKLRAMFGVPSRPADTGAGRGTQHE